MKAEKPWIENTREFFGLIILAFAIGINLLMHKGKTNEHQLWDKSDEPKYASSSSSSSSSKCTATKENR